MKVIIIDIVKEFKDSLANVIAESIYNYYCYHNYRAYEIILDTPETDEAKISTAIEYRAEYLIVSLMEDRTREELPVDMQADIVEEIKITGFGE